VAVITTDVSEEHIASIFRVKMSELRTTLAITNNYNTLRRIKNSTKVMVNVSLQRAAVANCC
jgi:hypothetical protein